MITLDDVNPLKHSGYYTYTTYLNIKKIVHFSYGV